MIPKIIHYCWFGRNPLPELAVKCIESWRKYLPDYEIKEWNEDNYDIRKISYISQAYDAKKAEEFYKLLIEWTSKDYCENGFYNHSWLGNIVGNSGLAE